MPGFLDRYLARVGLEGRPGIDLARIDALLWAQRLSIPYDALDARLGRGVDLAPDIVANKLLSGTRGGYCFELNQILARALEALGFVVVPMLARVWFRQEPGDDVPPRTHIVLAVALNGERWLVDAGFGGGHVPAMPLRDGAEAPGNDGANHRLRRDAEFGWMLERHFAGQCRNQYSFTDDRALAADIAMSNHWTATSPRSRFICNVLVSQVTRDGLKSITNAQFSVQRGESVERTAIDTRETMQALLANQFGIALTLDEVERLALF
ncbi:arylamine N-acetyltransferase family protein [Blastomonas aquatica]|uniref:Arylamine N-acetyltransferase n=1 Tax=Blastomonas aquatica TaxID=1510276 RepID=A0ABQ1IVX1_9SPHN|nr:arylamine N-acetyltransferase [Blastomonas aquatica]GGB53819.1 arylamine N-acetyltransferase [Blastomonas aquatica]